MEKRDALFLLLVLGGAGYAGYTHWDVIAEKLSFADLSPGRLKAIDLAKDASDLGQGFTNWQYLQTLAKQKEIELPAEPWSAEPIAGESYRVYARWSADGDTVLATWQVDVAERTVRRQDAAAFEPASPR